MSKLCFWAVFVHLAKSAIFHENMGVPVQNSPYPIIAYILWPKFHKNTVFWQKHCFSWKMSFFWPPKRPFFGHIYFQKHTIIHRTCWKSEKLATPKSLKVKKSRVFVCFWKTRFLTFFNFGPFFKKLITETVGYLQQKQSKQPFLTIFGPSFLRVCKKRQKRDISLVLSGGYRQTPLFQMSTLTIYILS